MRERGSSQVWVKLAVERWPSLFVSGAINRRRLRNEVWRQGNCCCCCCCLLLADWGRGNSSTMTYIYFSLIPFVTPTSHPTDYTPSLRQSNPHPPCLPSLPLHRVSPTITTNLLSAVSLFFSEIEDGVLLISLRMVLGWVMEWVEVGKSVWQVSWFPREAQCCCLLVRVCVNTWCVACLEALAFLGWWFWSYIPQREVNLNRILNRVPS